MLKLMFVGTEFPFLGASPDGLMYVGVGGSALVEVKCPYKHRNSTIANACKDTDACKNRGLSLKTTHLN